MGDPDRLREVLWNLLSNAVKFTPDGGRVEVLLEQVGDYGRVIVSDTDVGIDAALLPHVFEPFRQADGAGARRHKGLGLGLSIVRHIVEMQGGAVSADSRGEGRGATFTVTLPLLVGEPGVTRPSGEGYSETTGEDVCQAAKGRTELGRTR